MKLPVPYFSFFYFKVFHFLNHRIKLVFISEGIQSFITTWTWLIVGNLKLIASTTTKIQKTSRKNWITISFIYIRYFITTYYFCIGQKNKTKQIIQELKHFVPISVEYIESILPHLASFKLKKDDAIQTAGLSDWFLYNREEGLLNVKVTLKPCFHLML